MGHEQVRITTCDGECPAHVLTPAEAGAWPAVIFYADAGGIRPAVVEMAQRLAAAGYVVLLPDLFYRYGPYGPLVPKEVFQGDVGAILGPLMATTGNLKAAEDTAAFLAYLDTRSDVAGTKVGAVGFCMGGRLAMTAAATYPERLEAVASFHGGHLATDAPDSPHLLAPRIQAEIYVAGADQDDSYPPAMAERLAAALTEAGVRHCAEIYPGAAHGWMVTDFPVYDEAAAERGWKAMLALFERNLLRPVDRLPIRSSSERGALRTTSATLKTRIQIMATSPPVKGPASYFPSIEAKYGKPIGHWMEVLRAAGPLKYMAYVALLKTDHGMGHGHANALVAAYLAQNK